MEALNVEASRMAGLSVSTFAYMPDHMSRTNTPNFVHSPDFF